MASSLRLRILRICLSEAHTNKEIARTLGRDPASVLHHTRILVRTGFLKAQEERRGARGAREIPYLATRKSWTLSTPRTTARRSPRSWRRPPWSRRRNSTPSGSACGCHLPTWTSSGPGSRACSASSPTARTTPALRPGRSSSRCTPTRTAPEGPACCSGLPAGGGRELGDQVRGGFHALAPDRPGDDLAGVDP
ncbi:winged helix-turn-helix transcriptional regulator [Streptacidiphilus sp. 4-A2]|nr:winged helix-turn-helix transcriptional regulator [Streptacidiphilus sp. 4-A2]